MSAVSELIDVRFTDLTNYGGRVGVDVIGCPIYHHWGESDKLLELGRVAFLRMYAESAPIGSSLELGRYYAYASLLRAFECGASSVEVVRVQGDSKFSNHLISDSGVVSSSLGALKFGELGTNVISVSSKYAGLPPKSLCNGYEVIALRCVGEGSRVTLSVCGCEKTEVLASGERPSYPCIVHNGSYWKLDILNPIEQFEGSLDALSKEDGRSLFIEALCSKSQFIDCKVNVGKSFNVSVECDCCLFLDGALGEVSKVQWQGGLDMYRDTMISSTTLLLSPLSDGSLSEYVLGIARERKDMQCVIGLPLSELFTFNGIKAYLEGLSGVRNMFGLFVAGRERYSLFGYGIELDCVGGYCGHTCAIASSVRTNQLASAFTYGGYNGALIASLSFEEVSKLMELGCISVFTSNQGALIWGVRSLHLKQGSYYGKANVMRVLTKVLRQVFPVCLDAIHTDTASNAMSRVTFENRLKSIIRNEVAQENLKSQSSVVCDAVINSDVLSEGGTVLNVQLSLWFIGLTERVRIEVFATDSSVTAEIE